MLLLLVARLFGDVRYPSHLDAILWCLLVQVLERVLIEVDGLGSVALWRSLLELVVNTFEATTTNFLSR